ncbi:MAG: hypothetical protein KF831_13430 [Acidobacteria bacterium]|nr:hypothetical protein [Acidobacteriota bacterium]
MPFLTLGRSVMSLMFVMLPISFSLVVSAQETVSGDEPSDRKIPKFEIGGHGTIMFQGGDIEPSDIVFLRAGFPDRVTVDKRYESGFGGRFTFNVNRNLALESELNFTPSTKTFDEIIRGGSIPTRRSSGGEKTQFLAGVKYGYRGKRFGVFGKVRPGFIRFNAFPSINFQFVVPSPGGGQPKDILIGVSEKPATFFNVDIGGVFEYYPTKRSVIRFDAGDTIIRFHGQEPKDINPSFTRHNLQMNLGFGFRF